jgi:hypothetical protein
VALEARLRKKFGAGVVNQEEIGPERKIPAPFRRINAAHVSSPLGLRTMLSRAA